MFRKSIDTVVIALIFVVAAKLLQHFHFWHALGLPEPTSFVFIGLMFMTLVVIMQHTVFEPFMAIANERIVQTTDKRRLADERKVQAEGILKSYEQKILDARMEAMKQRERIAMEAEAEEKKMTDAAKQKSQSDLENAVKEIAAQVEKTRGELSQSTGALVQQLVDEVLSPQTSQKAGSASSKSVESRM